MLRLIMKQTNSLSNENFGDIAVMCDSLSDSATHEESAKCYDSIQPYHYWNHLKNWKLSSCLLHLNQPVLLWRNYLVYTVTFLPMTANFFCIIIPSKGTQHKCIFALSFWESATWSFIYIHAWKYRAYFLSILSWTWIMHGEDYLHRTSSAPYVNPSWDVL